MRFLSYCALETTKKAAAHIRNSGLRPEILFGSLFTPAHRLRNRFRAKPPWHLLPGWQTAAFAAAIPNAAVSEPSFA
jgi:hypothetical protein